jgi:lipid-A-disaccharide synthase
VVAYKGAAVNFFIAKSIIKIKYISLGNLILGRTCFRELLQYYFTPDNVLAEVRRLLEDGWYRDRMLEGYSRIRESLGGTGASAAVAKAMIEELEK